MDRTKRSTIFISVIFLIILFAALHFLAGHNRNESTILIGAIISTLFLLAFGLLVLHSHNITAKSEEQLKSILDSTAEAIIGVDTEGTCAFVNRKCLEMLGYEREGQVVGKCMHTLTHASDRNELIGSAENCRICKMIQQGIASYLRDEVIRKADGTLFHVECRTNPLVHNGKTTGAVVTFSDITEKLEAEAHIRYLSFHDPITELYNQTFFYEELQRLDVDRNLPFSVIIGDANGLKLTNDVFGHEVGDILLKRIADTFRNNSRADDIIARVGGDEFAMLLPGTTFDDASAIGNRIQQAVSQIDYHGIKGSLAIGIATKQGKVDDVSETLKEAEEEMYVNKSLNRQKLNVQQLEQISHSLHQRSKREKLHAQNVSEICQKIATQLQLSNQEIRRAQTAGYYHDIGKVVLKDEILRKIGNLNHEEQTEMRRHALVGYRILNLFDETIDIAIGALDHHEHWDGSGYPKGLKDEEISLLGRIIAVAEAFDFRTNSYSSSQWKPKETIQEISDAAGIRFDPNIVKALARVIEF
ncbi:MAG: diguanylate cyclase [Clostridiaceae bacterium]|jgi:diguanylate cyclase (GGDEF)-like protein/PAS domain S-box-containing protein|nr:diguanylate cyclase [Clostridiaceae bacterium]